MTYAAARKALPKDAEWSSSFGNPGEGGYVEYYHTTSGRKWVISNGPYCWTPGEDDWRCVPA